MIECSGFNKLSLVDWPGKVSAVVFLRGCNFRCPWCQNPNLVEPSRFGPVIPVDDIMRYLKKRREMLDGLVVTGGEPTLSPGLTAFLSQVKETGIPVKLDTNGSRPEVVGRLLNQRLVDTVAVDYKVPLRMYGDTVGYSKPGQVAKTIAAVLHRGCGCVRTTVVPGLHTEELLAEMLGAFPGLNKINYRLQGFRPGSCLDPAYNGLPPVTSDEITRLSIRIPNI
ncbi:MAG: anaerobic ribonucleoside-triphosphate reductase activating protein [Peptococcaceae bacterium]|nr:anaerobic ribonucleoside-triphosphate reductase activating protein [Peptococcaceae bacterium]